MKVLLILGLAVLVAAKPTKKENDEEKLLKKLYDFTEKYGDKGLEELLGGLMERFSGSGMPDPANRPGANRPGSVRPGPRPGPRPLLLAMLANAGAELPSGFEPPELPSGFTPPEIPSGMDPESFLEALKEEIESRTSGMTPEDFLAALQEVVGSGFEAPELPAERPERPPMGSRPSGAMGRPTGAGGRPTGAGGMAAAGARPGALMGSYTAKDLEALEALFGELMDRFSGSGSDMPARPPRPGPGRPGRPGPPGRRPGFPGPRPLLLAILSQALGSGSGLDFELPSGAPELPSGFSPPELPSGMDPESFLEALKDEIESRASGMTPEDFLSALQEVIGSGFELPSGMPERPSGMPDRPSMGGRPPFGGNRPSMGGNMPSMGGDRPSMTGENRPSMGGNMPTGENRPTGENLPSMGGSNRPALGGMSMSEGRPSRFGQKLEALKELENLLSKGKN